MNLKLPLTGLLGLGATLNGHAESTPKQEGTTQPPSSKPNVLIIYTDDMGVGDVSFLITAGYKRPISTFWLVQV